MCGIRCVGMVWLSLAVLFCANGKEQTELAAEIPDWVALKKTFESETGLQVLLEETDLPPGLRYERNLSLPPRRRAAALSILQEEVKKYSPRALVRMGLRRIGIFDRLLARKDDGYHAEDQEYPGLYRYYGLSDLSGGILCAYYTDAQLPLTLHHEVFHHLDCVENFAFDRRWFTTDDIYTQRINSGTRVYERGWKLGAEEAAALRKVASGAVLRDYVGGYARSASSEDQAETARYFMSHLPDALLQCVDHPDLAGTQKILYVMRQYWDASGGEMDFRHFVRVALPQDATARADITAEAAKPETSYPYARQIHEVANRLEQGADFTARERQLEEVLLRIHPACVSVAGASGVNIAPEGLILTAGHVVKDLIRGPVPVMFPMGEQRYGTVVSHSEAHDLALVRLLQGPSRRPLPYAPFALEEPAVGSVAAVIGCPAAKSGRGTFHTSVGKVLWYGPRKGLMGDMAYDAWTYWGHSGAPVFNERGQLVGIHNSWDSGNCWRHGLRLNSIRRFLGTAGVDASQQGGQEH